MGAVESDIYMNGDKIKKILHDHPEMTIREIERIPEMLEDPALILKSKGTGKRGNNSRMVLYGSIKAKNGQPVLAVLDLWPRENGFLLDDMQKVNSAYTRNDPANFVMSSEVMYADRKRTIPLLRQFGLAIASRRLLQNGPMGSISYDGDTVKMSGVPFSSVVDLDGGETRFSLKEDRQGRRLTAAEVRAVQRIPQKSIFDFTREETREMERYARRYWEEMGERSPFFRAWFGEWRSRDATPVQVADEEGDARGSCYNEDTGWKIQVSGKVFHETAAHKGKKNTAARPYLRYLNDIVEKAVLLDSLTMGEGKTKSGNSLLMHSLYAVADMGNGPEVLKLYVEEMNDPNADGTVKRAYQLQNIERQQPGAKGSGVVPSLITQAADIKTIADLYAVVKGRDGKFTERREADPVLLDQDGTPKVFYHGTDTSFTVFDIGEVREREGSFFFAENKEDAAAYGEKMLEVYLSAEKLADYVSQPAEFYRLRNKREQVAYLKKRGYDGWYADMDSGGWGEVSVFSPEQIKSATDNIGTFDRTDPDIRHSLKAGTESKGAAARSSMSRPIGRAAAGTASPSAARSRSATRPTTWAWSSGSMGRTARITGDILCMRSC